MKARIRLETITDIGNFVVAVVHATSSKEKVYVTDGDRICISAKSFLGLTTTRKFDRLYVESDKDIYSSIRKWVIEEDSPTDDDFAN